MNVIFPPLQDVAESLVLSLMSLWSDPAIREKTDARACMQRLVSQLTRGRNGASLRRLLYRSGCGMCIRRP